MELNGVKKHTIYGVVLFLILLGLIYLLNKKNNVIIDIEEGFKGVVDNFITYEQAYFDLDNKFPLDEKIKTKDDVLNSCMKDKNCMGITFDDDNYYIIKNINTCYSSLLGSGIQKADAKNYTTYLKKSVPLSDKLCLTSATRGSFFTIGSKNNLYLCAIDNQLYGVDKNKIQFNKISDNSRFKIVSGLYSSSTNPTISFKLESGTSSSNLYISHNFPRSKNIILKEIKSGDSEVVKKSATFRLVGGLSNEGFSIKLLDIPNTFLRFETQKNNTRVIATTIENKNNIETNDLATFYMMKEIEKVDITPESIEEETKHTIDDEVEDEMPVSSITKEEKIKRMKNKNMSVLEKQTMLLEEQNKKINNMELVHLGNIGKISREFANQSAQLALGKYLKEKNDIDILQKNNPDNTPSVEKFRGRY
jgi:hypothetical protein